MNFKLSIYLFLLLGIFTGGCKTTRPVVQDQPETVELTILHINDVYEIGPLENGTAGGMARVTTLNQQLHQTNPHTYMILAGDFLGPSVIGTVKLDEDRISGAQMVDVMNHAGVDLVTFGNHEFDLKPRDLQKRLNESTFTWISGNVFRNDNGQKNPFYKEKNNQKIPLPPYTVWTIPVPGKDSLKVGVIAVCLDANRVDFVHYDEVFESAKNAYATLSPKTDFVIAVTHLAIEDDQELARQLPGLKLIMGGHEHENHYEKIGAVPIAKADANAKSAYVHRVRYEPHSREVSVTSTLKQLNEAVPLDPEVDSLVQSWEKRAYQAFLDQGFDMHEVIATVSEPLDGLEKHIRAHPTNLGVMIAQAMFEAAGDAQLAIFNSGSVRIDDYLNGNITQFDLIRTLPFGGKLVKVDMKGSLLQQVLDTGKANQGNGGYLQLFMVNEKNNSWIIGDNPLNTTQVYRVVMPDFLLTGLESNLEFLTRDNPGIQAIIEPAADESLRDVRLTLIDFLKKQ